MLGILWTTLWMACGEKNTDSASIQPWASAELSTISGTCPVIDGSRSVQTFTSNGTERTVQFVMPSSDSDNIQPVFFFHGLMPEGSNPTNQLITALSLQEVADRENVLFILPVSPIWDLFGQRFHLWNIEQGTEVNDLTMFDDLRSCVAQHYDVYNSDRLNLDRLSVMGFSGGALFTTVVLSNRADTLASAVEMSGGADLSIPGFENPFSVHNSSSVNVPVLLMSGGDSDVWPNASMPVVDFEEASQHLFTELQGAEQTSVLCTHNTGHNIPPRGWTQALDWITSHEYNLTSPFVTEVSDWTDWCTWTVE